MPDDQDVVIKNDGETSEHIEAFGRLDAYRDGTEEVRVEVRVQPEKTRKDPKKEEKKEKEPQASLFDF